jgi:hypothetical protein
MLQVNVRTPDDSAGEFGSPARIISCRECGANAYGPFRLEPPPYRSRSMWAKRSARRRSTGVGSMSKWRSARQRKALWKPMAAYFEASMAEIEEFTMPEILHALRTTYGAKPDPTRRLELLHDKNGRRPEAVTLAKAGEYRSTPARRRRVRTVGRRMARVSAPFERMMRMGRLTPSGAQVPRRPLSITAPRK